MKLVWRRTKRIIQQCYILTYPNYPKLLSPPIVYMKRSHSNGSCNWAAAPQGPNGHSAGLQLPVNPCLGLIVGTICCLVYLGRHRRMVHHNLYHHHLYRIIFWDVILVYLGFTGPPLFTNYISLTTMLDSLMTLIDCSTQHFLSLRPHCAVRSLCAMRGLLHCC